MFKLMSECQTSLNITCDQRYSVDAFKRNPNLDEGAWNDGIWVLELDR